MRKMVIAVVVLVGFAGVCWAQFPVPLDIQKELALYGNLAQTDAGITSNGEMACGPVAVTNSLAYLQNKYGGVYDTLLIPDVDGTGTITNLDLVSVCNTLMTANYMNTGAGGTTQDNLIWGKEQWIEGQAKGKTKYAAQDSWGWVNHTQPDYVQSMYPTWSFLYNELVACEDVEILISIDAENGHYVTLTSFHWADTNNNGIIDDSGAFIDFIDPLTGGVNQTSISQSTLNGKIFTAYFSSTPSYIATAVSESPTPEPATMTLLVLGLGGAALLRRRMK